jgi:hypothetical protein
MERLPIIGPGLAGLEGERRQVERGLNEALIAFYRLGTGEWLVREDSGTAPHIAWGGPEDRPAPAALAPVTTSQRGR